jgi:hypothetical protein
MADQKGILNKDQEKIIAELLDKKVVFNKPILEAVDGYVFKAIITIVDDYGLEKLQENYKEKADELADALLAENWEVVIIVIWELTSLIIKELIAKKQ